MSRTAEWSVGSNGDDPDELQLLAGDSGGWLQLDLDLGDARDDMRRREDIVLSSLWHGLRDCPAVDGFWYLRKPPGLRVRIAASIVLQPTVAPLLVRERNAGNLRSWVRGVYEPECHRFGGPAGLALAHELLSASATSYLELAAARQGVAEPIDTTVAAIAIYDALVRETTADRPERWDVWSRLAQLYFGVRPTPGSAVRREAALDWTRLPSFASPPERDALFRAFAAFARVAHSFEELVRRGATDLGPRTFAVTFATFHWNVWAVDRTDLRQACELMLAELDPVPRSEDE